MVPNSNIRIVVRSNLQRQQQRRDPVRCGWLGHAAKLSLCQAMESCGRENHTAPRYDPLAC